MAKSDNTRAKITETAIASFRERGYNQTTIRLIAEEANISVGNAYLLLPDQEPPRTGALPARAERSSGARC
jgi:AcrR family transcriptional regulator